MKIVFFSHGISPRPGGVERSVYETALALHRAGHVVTIVTPCGENHRVAEPFSVVNLSVRPHRPITRVLTYAWMWKHRSLFSDAEVLHFHDYSTFLHWFLPLRLLLRDHVYALTYHGYDSWPIHWHDRLLRRCAGRAMHVRFGVGAYLKILYRDRYDHIYIGGATVQPTEPMRNPDFDVVYIGRMESDTGLPNVLKALQRIAMRHDEHYRVLLVGSGSLSDSYRTKLVDGLSITTMAPVADPAPYYRNARCVIPSGFLSLFDGCACQAAQVVPMLTDLRRHYFQSVEDLERYAWIADSDETLEQHLDHVLHLDRLSQEYRTKIANAQRILHRHNWDAVASQLISSYQDVLRFAS